MTGCASADMKDGRRKRLMELPTLFPSSRTRSGIQKCRQSVYWIPAFAGMTWVRWEMTWVRWEMTWVRWEMMWVSRDAGFYSPPQRIISLVRQRQKAPAIGPGQRLHKLDRASILKVIADRYRVNLLRT